MSGGRLTSGRALALIRLAAVPVFLVAERSVAHPAARDQPFGALLVLAGVYAVTVGAAELRGRDLAPPPVLAVADLALVTALVATSGGPFSELRYAFFVLPVGTALLLRPGLTALISGVAVALYVAVAVTYPDPEQVRRDATGFETTQALFLLWMGGAATLLSAVLTRRAERIRELADGRGRLVAQALDAEDRARRRLAEGLHDEALQNLLAARQLLDGDADSAALVREGLDEGVAQIRDAVFDLHPYLLERSGLRAALSAVAERAAQRAGFAASVDVGPDVEGVHDQLLFSIGRELIANAAKHSGAATLTVRAARRNGEVELAVVDDGRGLARDGDRAGPDEGHIGLASASERAEAVGGRLETGPGRDGRGTAVRVVLPAPTPRTDRPTAGRRPGVA